jgi:hypothetical protein
VISRRTFLAGSAAAALLAACGDDNGGIAGGDETPAPLVPDRLGNAFADGYASELSSLVAGIPQRAPFIVVTDVGQPLTTSAPATIDVEVLHGGTAVASFTVPRHDRGIITPYYPVVFTPPEPGDYEIRSNLPGPATPFKVAAREQLSVVQIGDKLRPVDTPTTADARGVDPVCTRTVPGPCPFHDRTLTEAMAGGRPVVFIISTPGFCQTEICGPVLELAIEAAPAHTDFAIVHAEVYVAPEQGDLTKTTPAIATYGLAWEPSLYVADATGTVTARLDFLWDGAEFDQAVASIA